MLPLLEEISEACCLSYLFSIFINIIFSDVLEFKSIVGSANADALASSSTPADQQRALRDCFSALMKSDPDVVKQEVEKLAARLERTGKYGVIV